MAFYEIIVASSFEDLEHLEFPCTILVGSDDKDTREEGLNIVFKQQTETKQPEQE